MSEQQIVAAADLQLSLFTPRIGPNYRIHKHRELLDQRIAKLQAADCIIGEVIHNTDCPYDQRHALRQSRAGIRYAMCCTQEQLENTETRS